MQKLSTNGYYLSEAIHYEDWHAGAKHEWWYYVAYHFKENGKVATATNKHEPNFCKADFQSDKSRMEYEINGNILEFINDRGGRFEVSSFYTILGIDAITSESANRKYRWTAW